MTGQREPLWASSLAHQPEGLDDVVARWEPDEPVEAPAPPRARARRLPVGAFGLAAAIAAVAVAVAIVASAGGTLAVSDVPSAWKDIPMTCHTARFVQDDHALELFSCRALGGASLPAGSYRSPDAQWTSDITRRPARATRIVISRDGQVGGWAAY